MSSDDPRAAFDHFFVKTPVPYTCERKEVERQLKVLEKGELNETTSYEATFRRERGSSFNLNYTQCCAIKANKLLGRKRQKHLRDLIALVRSQRHFRVEGEFTAWREGQSEFMLVERQRVPSRLLSTSASFS